MSDTLAVMIAQLADPDAFTRTQAAERLERLPDTRAVLPLLQCLRDPSDTVQAAAAAALGATKDVRAVDPLIRMFHGATYGLLDRDGSPGLYFRILASAACALARIGANPGVEALFAQVQIGAPNDWLKTEAAVLALGDVRDPRTLPTLLTLLHSPSPFVRMYAAAALGQVGDLQAVEALLQGLHDADPLVQIAAAEALGTLRDVRAVAALQAVFQHGATYVPRSREARICLQAKAARGLALIGESSGLHLLERNLHSKRWGRQVAAAIGLIYRYDTRGFAILIQALEVPLTSVQIEVVQSLGHLADEQAIQTLNLIAQHQRIPSSVTDCARQMLKQINQRHASGAELPER